MKKNIYSLLSMLFVLSLNSSLIAQLSFTNQSDLLNNQNIHSGSPAAVADVNGDFLDDIIRFDRTTDMTIEYQNFDGTFMEYEYGNVSNDSWAICVADINNDGYCEVMSGGVYNGVQLLKANGTADFSFSQLDGPSIFVQGSHFADFNNDGHLDLFACHDDGPSNIWMNDGNGNLAYDENMIDLSISNIIEENAGNYGVVWTDFDSDGDLDMYIAKCRQGASSVTDIRRINQLWVNDGNYHFTEDAASYGLDVGWQSWTAEFQDIDNDGDMDCFLANHDHGSQLLENVDNQFRDITESSGIDINGFPIQAAMKDFDNDGFVDLLISGGYYRNNGDKTFEKISDNPVDNDINSFAIGDLNHDGFWDIYAVYSNGINYPGSKADKLLINDANDNNYFNVNLHGQQSNRNGVGARVELHGDWGIMIREVRAGESYGIAHSFTQHFGMGAYSQIDSVVVKWPSGIKDVFDDVDANQFITVLEGNCISPNAAISLNGSTVLCSGESVDLTAPSGYSYNWSNGATTQTITVTEEGAYNVSITDGTGCLGISTAIQVVVNPAENVEIFVNGNLAFCEGAVVTLSSSEANGYLWSNGATTQAILVTEAGTYSLEAEGDCNTLYSEEVILTTLAQPIAPIVTDITLEEPSSAILTAPGDKPEWYDEPIDGTKIGEGNTFITPFLSMNTTYYVQDILEHGNVTDGNVGELEHSGSSEYSGDEYNGEIIFDCFDPFILKSTVVYTDTPGNRVIELRDEEGNVLANKIVDIPEGESEIIIDFEIPEGNNLVLSTSQASNQTNFGHPSPRLRRTNTGTGGTVQYPYEIEDLVLIKDSNYGGEFYYYFYNWTVELPVLKCPSERVPLNVTVVGSTAVLDVNETDAIEIFPNPTSGDLTLSIKAGNTFDVRLMDITGRVIHTEKISAFGHDLQHQLSLHQWAKGVYWIQFTDKNDTYNSKVIFQ